MLFAKMEGANLDNKLILQSEIAKLNAEIEEKILDSMDKGITELGSEIKSLNESTTTLNKTAEKLQKSSDRLNAVTEALLILTAVLAIAGTGSYVLQSLHEAGISGEEALKYTSVAVVVVLAALTLAFNRILRMHRPSSTGRDPE